MLSRSIELPSEPECGCEEYFTLDLSTNMCHYLCHLASILVTHVCNICIYGVTPDSRQALTAGIQGA